MRTLRNQSGQMILESILILTILLAITMTTASQLKQNETFAKMMSGPWSKLAGMIQNGVWMEPGKSDAYHPNHAGRGASLSGQSAQ